MMYGLGTTGSVLSISVHVAALKRYRQQRKQVLQEIYPPQSQVVKVLGFQVRFPHDFKF
jgi:hypothetical protein